MSKSKHNGINPTHVIHQHGSDATRMYILSLNAPAESVLWDATGIVGMERMLARLARLARSIEPHERDDGIRALERSTALRVGHAFTHAPYPLHTALADLSKLLNATQRARDYRAVRSVVRMLAPYAPSLCAELWRDVFGREEESLDAAPWPEGVEVVGDQEGGGGGMVPVSVTLDGRALGGESVVRIPVERQGDADSALEYILKHYPGVEERIGIGRRVKRVMLKEKKHGGYLMIIQVDKQGA